MHYSDESEYIIKSLSFKCSNEYKQLTFLLHLYILTFCIAIIITASPLTAVRPEAGGVGVSQHDWCSPLTPSVRPLSCLCSDCTLVSGLQLTLTLTAALAHHSDQPRMAGPASSGPPGVMSWCEARHHKHSAI